MEIVIGAIKGRHELPVEEYIFDEAIEDVTDVEAIYAKVEEKLNGASKVVLYVTGLTVVTTAVCAFCFHDFISLTLKHFDNATQTYFEQVIL